METLAPRGTGGDGRPPLIVVLAIVAGGGFVVWRDRRRPVGPEAGSIDSLAADFDLELLATEEQDRRSRRPPLSGRAPDEALLS